MDAATDDLAKLVREAQRRNPDAFVALIEILRPRLWARALALAAEPADAEDLLQETCLRAYEKLADLQEPRAVLSWLLTILDRLGSARHARRSEKSWERMEARHELTEPDAGQAFLELAEGAEAAEELHRALGELAQADRELLALRFGADLNATQMAQTLGLSPEAVRARLSRVLGRLRKRMGVQP